MPVDTEHPEYAEALPAWTRARDRHPFSPANRGEGQDEGSVCSYPSFGLRLCASLSAKASCDGGCVELKLT